jgi:hypothetical protein
LLPNRTHVAAALVLVAAVAAPANAASVSYATVSAKVAPATVHAGGKANLLVQIVISPDYHINAHKPADAYAIPTVFTPSPVAGVTFGVPIYPSPLKVTESYSPAPLLVYEKLATISVPVTFSKSAVGKISLGGTVSFQGCNHQACFPPKTVPISVALTVK